MRRLAQDVDFVPPGALLDNYKLVIVPSLLNVSDRAQRAFETTTATVLYGPRTGSKTRHAAIPEGLAPGPLRALLGLRVTQVSSLRPNLSDKVTGQVNGSGVKWQEYLETDATIFARFANDDATFTCKGKHHYLACIPDEKLLTSTMAHVCNNAGLKTEKLPPHIRVRCRGNLAFVFNYGNVSWDAPKNAKMIIGRRAIAPQSFGIWSTEN